MCSIKEKDLWITIEACPACGNTDELIPETLQLTGYRHGNEEVSIPREGVRLMQCSLCGLAFKDVLPSPRFLTEVFARQAGKVWRGGYSFEPEKQLILKLTGGEAFDLLDVGSSDGGFLRALHGVTGRRSALDIVIHPGLERWLRGEFLEGLADSEQLSWSEEPYDVVTLFDVAEHLYRPDQAFSNLRRLVKPGGYVVIETGDLESAWPSKHGANCWWYACLFEHHVFWSERSLASISALHGFQMLDIRRKRHKDRAEAPLRREVLETAKVLLYKSTEAGYERVARLADKRGIQPRSPFTRDHVRVVLRRN